MRAFRLLAAILILVCAAGQAAEAVPQVDFGRYHYRSWSVEQGLPQVTVNGVQRTAGGALWIATEQGLVRSYGSEFEIFRSSDTPALATNWIRQILTVGPLLYVATQKNLALWDGQHFNSIRGSEHLGTVRAIAAEDNGSLWILADRLNRWDGALLRTFSELPAEFTALALAGTEPALADKEGRLWILRGGRLEALPLRWPDGGAHVRQLLWRDGVWWLGTSQGLFRWAPERGATPERVGPDSSQVEQLSLDRARRLWVLSASGVRVLDGEGVETREIAALASNSPASVSSPRVLLAEDLDSFWVGSLTSGLRHFWRGRTGALAPEGAATPLQTWSYLPTRHGLLVGSSQGIWRVDGDRLTPFYNAPALSGQVVYSMLEDKAGRLWLGTRNGLYRLDADQLQSVSAMEGIQVNTLFQASDGQLLAATAQGLYALDGGQGVRRLFREQLPGTVSIMHESSDGGLWVGGANGLWRWQVGGNGPLTAQVPAALGQTLVTALTGYGERGVLVGTYQHGIHLIDGNVHRQWRKADGMPSDGVVSLNQHDGWFWATFFDGIFRFQLPATGSSEAPLVQLVYVDPGNVAGRSRIRCCNGLGRDKGYLAAPYLWAASLAGAVRTELDIPAPTLPRAVLSKVVAQGGSALGLLPGAIELAPEQRGELEIGFEGEEFREPEYLQYRYRMPPFQAEWRLIGKRHTAYYTNLPVGEFRFEAQTSWDGQHWGQGTQLTVRTAPLWHERWFVRVGGLLLGILAVYGLLQWRLKQVQARSVALQREVTRQTEALRHANAELENLNRSLEQASLTDTLTGLRNRRYVQQQVPGMVASLKRRRAVPGATDVLGALLIDLDHFKRINDTHGHDIGDAVLEAVAQALRSVVRGEDHSVRWGGEEFLLLVHASGRDELWVLAERVHAALASQAGGTAAGPVTASIGIASLPMGATTLDERAMGYLLQLADYSLYAAKEAGRNATVLADLSDELLWSEGGVEQFKAWQAQGSLRMQLRKA